jgi:hypothetical protein
MIAINGPMQGKYYHDGVTANKLVDHVRDDAYNIFELTYYRTKNGWAFHSWKRMY